MNVVARVNGPACRVTGGSELAHVADSWVFCEALSAALYDVAVQLTCKSFRYVLCTCTAGICEEPLVLLGVIDLEFETFGLNCDSSGIDASKQSVSSVVRINGI